MEAIVKAMRELVAVPIAKDLMSQTSAAEPGAADAIGRAWLFACALVALTACGSTKAAVGVGGAGTSVVREKGRPDVAGLGGTFDGDAHAIAQDPGCNQTDSTVSCCLKRHPGEYERCGAMPPKSNRPNPYIPPSSLTPKKRAERKEMCLDYYGRCIQAGGEYLERGTHGHTRCQSCYDECFKTGKWPKDIDGEPCPGGTQ